MAQKTRILAFKCLQKYEKNKSPHTDFLKQALNAADDMEQRDKAFMKTLVTGVLKQATILDAHINQYSKIPFHQKEIKKITILRMGAYQLLFLKTPPHAVVNEYVELTKSVGLSGLAPYINAVLRQIARHFEKAGELPVNPYPGWFNELIASQYDAQTINCIIEASLKSAPLSIRVTDTAQTLGFIRKCEDIGISISAHPYSPEAYTMKNVPGLHRVPGFENGLITVQDISGMLAVKCAGIKEGDIIADVCAAPGSKAVYAAQLTKDEGIVYAFDKSIGKVKKIKENAIRLRLENIETKVLDVSVADFKHTAIWEKCDILLCDLPCSGLGVIGKKPDIIYHMNVEKIDSLIALQKKILSNVWGLLKSGGVLLYSTCTINRRENIENVKWFINQFPFELQTINQYLPNELCSDETNKGTIQLLQGVNQSDGAFIARIIRK